MQIGEKAACRYIFGPWRAILAAMSLSPATPHPPDRLALPPGGRRLLFLGALFLLALLPRLYSSQTLGWDWDYPGSFTLVNFDEGGSCRAALDGFEYSPFIGRQTIALAGLLGAGPPAGIAGDERAVKTYCHSAGHILVARAYSALAGALTAPVIAVIGLLLVPARPGVGWTAGALLALSGFHISESHSGTVDAPSVFYIYTFFALMVYAIIRKRRGLLLISPVLLLPAIWTKYWVFAFFSYAAVIPERMWRFVFHGMSARRVGLLIIATAIVVGLITNTDFQSTRLYPLLALWYLLIPWRLIRRPMAVFWLLLPPGLYLLCQIDIIASYTTSGMHSSFGSGYAAIGWHKWLRNLVNLPLVLLVGLGLPAFLFLPAGIRAVAGAGRANRGWLCLAPLLVFALYMAFVAPITYYRHYLPLLPAAALLSALGLFATRWSRRPWFMALFLLWPALLALDLVGDYHNDPRVALRQWYREHPDARVFYSFYVNPPVGGAVSSQLFRPEYAGGDATTLRRASHVVLSENWYDTAFANELNGPLVDDLTRLVKTTPEHARFYREALAGRHPHLEQEQLIAVDNFMPELLLHRQFYGTFQLFVGDLRVFRVRE
ncbi:MAG: hypothetical protein H6985_00910 [Pseudomonadales bacterium]|nr:hypothetical protein [Pseudomonadales bacterium]